MSTNSNELIHRYLLGIAADDEVHELESRLQGDEKLQDEFLLQAELDAHLRQAAQVGSTQDDQPRVVARRSSPNVWKWVSGISTLSATILLTLLVLSFPPQKTVFAYPTLGELAVNVPWAEQNIWAAAGRGDVPGLLRERCEKCAKLFIIAENEELFDNKDHAIAAYNPATGVKELVTLKGIEHYGVYNEKRSEAQQLAIDWFREHLKANANDSSKAHERSRKKGYVNGHFRRQSGRFRPDRLARRVLADFFARYFGKDSRNSIAH